MFLKRKTCLKLPQWCIFQRFSRAAGISLFRQIAVQAHRWNEDRAGVEPKNNRPVAGTKWNPLCRQSRLQGTIMTGRNLLMKGGETCEHWQTWGMTIQLKASIIHMSATTVLICIPSVKRDKRSNSPRISRMFILLDLMFIQGNVQQCANGTDCSETVILFWCVITLMLVC